LLDELADLPDEQRVALTAALGLGRGSAGRPLVLVNAVLALLSRRAPLLLAIDDPAWLDRPSARLLNVVARRLTGTGVTMLAATRPAEDGYFDRSGLTTIEVRPLG